MLYVLDTHTLVWFLEQQEKLSRKVLDVLRSTQNKLIIPSIVLAEIKYLSVKGKVSSTFSHIVSKIEEDERCVIVNLDVHIIGLLPTTLEIHDGIIVATALVYQDLLGEDVTLLTRDEKITKSKLMRVLW